MSYEAKLFLCIAVGLVLGLLMGWFAWRLPMIWAEDRGKELYADGFEIVPRKDER